MYHDMAAKMARVMVNYSTAIKPGEFVYIATSILASPLVEAVYEEIVKQGAHAQVQWSYPPLEELFFHYASDDQLDWVNPALETIMSKADVYMVIGAETNPKAMTGVDPAKRQRLQQAAQNVYRIFYERMGSGAMRYHYALWPTNAAAQQAEMGLLDYTEFVYKACGLDQIDPVAHWQTFRDRQEKLVNWLEGKSHCQVAGPGIDLSFDFTDRMWINSDGQLNFPDGEIYTGPVEESVSGHVAFSYPSLYAGQEVNGIELTFKDGMVTDARAAKGEAHLLSQLDVDAGARRLGEFAIGTNFGVQQFTGNTLFDEKIGGTIHMALGNSIPSTGGVNQSAVHWDIVHDMTRGGTIHVDGELFYDSGRFVIEG